MRKRRTTDKIVQIVCVVLITIAVAFIIDRQAMFQSDFIGSATTLLEGCCGLTCTQSSEAECPTTFYPGQECSQISSCSVGCCIDNEGYCLSNYLRGTCEENDYRFLEKNECLHEPICITEPEKESLRGNIGYPYVFRANAGGFVFTDRFSGTVGDSFTIKSFLFDITDIYRLRAQLSADDFSKTLAFFDDGAHGDGNANDGVFAAVWIAEGIPDFLGIKKIDINAVVNDNSRGLLPDYVLLSSNQCTPLRKQWEDPEERQDIVIQHINPKIDQLGPSGLIDLFLSTLPADELDEKNFYEVRGALLSSDVGAARSRVDDQCTFLESDDIIIVLDGNADDCTSDGHVIHTPGSVVLNQTALDLIPEITADIFINKFCKFTETLEQRRAFEQEKLNPPTVIISTPVVSTPIAQYPTKEVDIQFTISDTIDEEVNYEIYRDMNNPLTVIGRGIAQRGVPVIQEIELTDGVHNIWVEAVDSDGNLGAADPVAIEVDVVKFIIDVTSLEPLTYATSPPVDFKISHRSAPSVEYKVLVNSTAELPFVGTVLDEGTAPIDTLIHYQSVLEQGTHIIQVVATDNVGRLAESLPYIIEIEPPAPPASSAPPTAATPGGGP